MRLLSILTVLVSLSLASCLERCLESRVLAQQSSERILSHDAQTKPSIRRRVALVIGNGAYVNAPHLKNAPHDATDMASTLTELGFKVVSGTNLNQRAMKNLIREFGQNLKAGGAGLFYFAGHGVQSKGRNYLIPVDADIQSEAELEDASVDVNLVLNYMDVAQNDLNIVILDACRNNPFVSSFRSASNGLAYVDAPTGTLIAYATAPGRVASDGLGRNGLYTAELLKHLRISGLSAIEMFMRVRAEVMKQTSGKQVPWEASSLTRTFYFKATKENVELDSITNTTVSGERALWDVIKDSTDRQDFRDFLSKYPTGVYADAAKIKLRRLEALRLEQKNGKALDATGTSQSNVLGNISIGSTGYVPGLLGRLNPILDSEGRTYIYGDNIAIEGGKTQPVRFDLNRPFQVEDSEGNRYELTVTAINKNGSKIRYSKLETSENFASVGTEIRVLDNYGSVVRNAEVLILFNDNTYVGANTDKDGKARVKDLKQATATVFCAHPGFSGYASELDLSASTTIQLRAGNEKGSVIFANGQGHIPGLERRLNPILDDLNRTYIYTEEKDKEQPRNFTVRKPFSVRDANGNQFIIEIVSIRGRSSLIEYRRM
jgi:hypothetical protein